MKKKVSQLRWVGSSKCCALSHTCLEIVPTEEKAAAALKVVNPGKTGGEQKKKRANRFRNALLADGMSRFRV